MSEFYDWNDSQQQGEGLNPQITPQVGRVESLLNAGYSTYVEGPTMHLLRMREIHKANKSDERSPIPVEKLNEMYPELPDPFQEPTKPSVAAIIANRQRYRRELEQKMQMGPQDWMQIGLNFGSGLVYGMADPTVVFGAVAAEAALVKAARSSIVTNMAARTGATGAIAKGAQFLGKGGFKAGAARDVTAGLTEGVASESIVAMGSAQDLTPYETEDFLMNTLVGAVLMPAVGGTYRLGRAGYKKISEFKVPESIRVLGDHMPESMPAMVNSAKGSMENNLNPKTDLILKDRDVEMNGIRPKFVDPDYSYKANIDNLKGQRVFGVINGEMELGSLTYDFASDGVMIVTDSPILANGIAGSKYGAQYPQIADFNITDDLKIAKFTDEYKGSTIGDEVERIKNGIESGELDGLAMDQFYSDLKAEGFDGIGGNVKNMRSDGVHDHNQIAIFEPEKLEAINSHKPDSEAIGKNPEAASDNKKNHLEEPKIMDAADEQRAIQNIKEFEGGPKELQQSHQVNERLNETLENLEMSRDLDLLTPEELLELDRIKNNIAEAEDMDLAMKGAASCVRGA